MEQFLEVRKSSPAFGAQPQTRENYHVFFKSDTSSWVYEPDPPQDMNRETPDSHGSVNSI